MAASNFIQDLKAVEKSASQRPPIVTIASGEWRDGRHVDGSDLITVQRDDSVGSALTVFYSVAPVLNPKAAITNIAVIPEGSLMASVILRPISVDRANARNTTNVIVTVLPPTDGNSRGPSDYTVGSLRSITNQTSGN